MTVLVRALGIGLAAVTANLLMSVGVDGDSGANIGAGLAIFAVLAGGGFTWALLDGLGVRRGASQESPTAGALVGRWVLASAGAVVVIIVAMTLRQGPGYVPDIGAWSVAFLVGLVLVPAVVGALIGWAARPTAPRGRS